MPTPPVDLDATATLQAAASAVQVRRGAEVEELRLALHWADLHGEPRHDRDPMTEPGGDGTPRVREFSPPELAMARGTHTLTTRALLADALDLRHRLPLTWARVAELACEPWVARKVAALSRRVAVDRVKVVDRAVAVAISGHAPSTVLEIAAAKVIEADTEAHAMERERERHRRYVAVSRADEFGYRQVIARATAGDAAWLDALVDRVADILAPDHGHDHTHGELRSLALGWLARPADLLQLLLGATDPSGEHHDRATRRRRLPRRPRRPVDERRHRLRISAIPDPTRTGPHEAWVLDHRGRAEAGRGHRPGPGDPADGRRGHGARSAHRPAARRCVRR